MNAAGHSLAAPGPDLDAFECGYRAGWESGLEVGLAWGRAELVRELIDVHAHLSSLQLSRQTTHADLEARRRTYRRPAQTADTLRAQAAASWGLPPPEPLDPPASPTQPTTSDAPGKEHHGRP